MGWFSDLHDSTKDFVNSVGNPSSWSSGEWLVTFDPGHFISYHGTNYAKDLWEPYLNPELPPPPPAQSGVTATQSSNIAYIPIVYGTRSVAGTRVFYHTTGDKNEFLHQVFCLCEGEISGVSELYIDDVLSTDSKFDGLVSYHVNTGVTDETAFADLVTAVPARWTADHKGNDTASIYVVCEYDETAFSGGFPQFKFIVDGKLLLDTRTDTTAFSTNPALALNDYLVNTRYGKGLDQDLVDTDAINTEADYAETQVEEYTGGPDINLFAVNGAILPNETILGNVNNILPSCRGRLVFSGGQYTLRCAKSTTSTFDFTSDNIIGGWAFSGASKKTLLNRIKAEYTAADQKFIQDFAIVSSATYLAEDNGTLLEKEMKFPMETSYYRTAHKCETALKASRNGIACSFTATIAAFKCEVGDVVTVTHETPGWVYKAFTIVSVSILPNCNVAVALAEHDDTIYDWDIGAEYLFPSDTTLPDAFTASPPTNLILASGDTELQVPSDGTVISRVKATWDAPTSSFVSGYVFEYKLSSSVEWTAVDVGKVTTAWISPVEDLKYYDVRVRSYNLSNIASTYLTVYGHQALGKSTPPNAVTSFSVLRQPDGTRQFDWVLDNPPADLAGFKIRQDPNFGQVWDDMADMHNGLLIASPFETNQLAAGDYTLAIKAVDTSGNESTSATYINSTLGDPRIAASIYSVNPAPYSWPGTKTNCFVSLPENILSATGQKDWSDLTSDSVDWDSWTQWTRDPNSPIVYEHTVIDLGATLIFNPLVTVAGNGTFTIEESHSDDDITYTSWAATGPQISARYTKIRVSCALTTGTPTITSLFINFSADEVSEVVNDLDTSALATCTPSPSCSSSGFKIAAGDFRVPITKSYTVITMVRLALQNVGAGWSWEIVDKDVNVGPRVRIYDGTGTLADATVDVEVTGV